MNNSEATVTCKNCGEQIECEVGAWVHTSSLNMRCQTSDGRVIHLLATVAEPTEKS